MQGELAGWCVPTRILHGWVTLSKAWGKWKSAISRELDGYSEGILTNCVRRFLDARLILPLGRTENTLRVLD